MTAYNSVFKRVEKKYRIGAAERAAVEAAGEGASWRWTRTVAPASRACIWTRPSAP